MKNFIFGFVLGIVIATVASAWAFTLSVHLINSGTNALGSSSYPINVVQA